MTEIYQKASLNKKVGSIIDNIYLTHLKNISEF